MKNTKSRYRNRVTVVSRPKFLGKRQRVSSKKPQPRIEQWANRAETSPLLRLWIRLNQGLPLLALAVALFAASYAYEKYIADESKAEEDRVAKAWDVVTRMAGRMSNGGQIEALQVLHRRNIALQKVDLHETYLSGLVLHGADLSEANLAGSDLSGSDLAGTKLISAELQGANLMLANLDGAALNNADLTGADLSGATVNLTIFAANLKDADISGLTVVAGDSEAEIIAMGDEVSVEDEELQETIDQACASKAYPPLLSIETVSPPKRECPEGREYWFLPHKKSRYQMPSLPN